VRRSSRCHASPMHGHAACTPRHVPTHMRKRRAPCNICV
jgi:hypothetical protein